MLAPILIRLLFCGYCASFATKAKKSKSVDFYSSPMLKLIRIEQNDHKPQRAKPGFANSCALQSATVSHVIA